MTVYTGSTNIGTNKNVIITYKNNNVVDNYALLYDITIDESKKIFKETIKFLYIRSISNQRILIPSKEVGQMWRLFLQHTKDYENFCNFYLHKKIHHQFGDKKDYSNYYKLTINEIKQHFHNFPIDVWNDALYSSISIANNKDVYNYQQPIPVVVPPIIKKSTSTSGCVEIFAILIVLLMITILFIFFNLG